MHGGKGPGEALRKLNPTRAMSPVGHDVVALVGTLSDADRDMLSRVLGGSFKMRAYGAPGGISASTRGQLALVIVGELDEEGRRALGEMLSNTSDETPLVERVPLVVTYGPADGAEAFVQDPRVDGILPSPMELHGGVAGVQFGLVAAVKFCTERFMEGEGVRAAEAIRKFTEEYLGLFKGYAESIKRLSFFRRAMQPTDIETVLAGVEQALEQLEYISQIAERDCSAQAMGRLGLFCHDLNNAMSIVIPWMGCVKEDHVGSISSSEFAFLQSVETVARRLAHDVVAIQNVLSPRGYTWQEFQMGTVPGGSFAKAELEVPQGLNVCIIEDNEDLARAMVKQATKKGGQATVAKNQAELLALLAPGGVVPDVFILDNELADGDYGHKLVSFIQVAAPGALIVVHTADLVALSKTPELYGDLPMVGKLDFAAINELIAKRFPPKA